MIVRILDRRETLAPALALIALAAGGLLHLFGANAAGHVVWAFTVAALLAYLAIDVAHTVVVKRRLGVDVIAMMAMAGALALGEELAGAVIALMFSGGAALERGAARRARRELTALVQRAPRIAHVHRAGAIVEVAVAEVGAGDVLFVRNGDVVPTDGEVVSDHAVIDESALTGESLPVTHARGDTVLSGTSNAGAPFELRATRPAAESAYAGLVRLVRSTEDTRAPFVRMADRYAALFLPATLIVAGAAWIVSGDAVRALAVLVVATPCPLILAAPIALVAGVSRAARVGVIVKGAAVVEALGAARTVLFDKTGTLTTGSPRVSDVVITDGLQTAEVLRLAASVDQLSSHVLAEALVHDAQRSGLQLERPKSVHEDAGQGVAGIVDGREILVGSRAFLLANHAAVEELEPLDLAVHAAPGTSRLMVAVDGHVAGAIVMADELRAEAHGLVAALRRAGIRHVAMLSGDRRHVAQAIGRDVGVDRVYAEQTPQGKLDIVRALRADRALGGVVMVGDGVNDAPALALADVGIAMGGPAATISAETADAVITVDRVDRVADAVAIGRRSLGLARQSVVAGMGLSIAAMGLAAVGVLAPVEGALLQEVIDVAVILNALRAVRA